MVIYRQIWFGQRQTKYPPALQVVDTIDRYFESQVIA